jgi:hypothetical protein
MTKFERLVHGANTSSNSQNGILDVIPSTVTDCF